MNNKDNKILKDYFTWNNIPNVIIDLFQWYLIADKILEINFFGQLSWLLVFVPTIITTAFGIIFYNENDIK